jgi:hypothetical protein
MRRRQALAQGSQESVARMPLISSDELTCAKCGNKFKRRGMGKHLSSCKGVKKCR